MGFMGAGKSTVGALLGHRLGWRFLDADLVLESKSGLTIADVFSLHGEPEFRRIESGVIRELLQEEGVVLALGGGAVETESTYDLLQGATATCLVFLEAPLVTLIERCEHQPGAAERPVLNDRDRLEARWKARLPLYRQAHLTVSTAGLTPDMVTEKIMSALHPRLSGEPTPAIRKTGEPASR